jgi:DNA topoisomerase-1
MKNLLIVESPAKCKKIQSFLGDGWRVIASMGHIRGLDEDLDALGINRNWEPRYTWMREKAKALAQIREEATKADTIYLASDDDREGEGIALAICEYLRLDPATTPRAVFHEITKTAVCSAVANPRIIDMNKALAQQARAMLDMLIGFTMSPLLWGHVGTGLSAGRCQIPALRLVVERENEITEHKSEQEWHVNGTWQTCEEQAISFTAELTDNLEDEESVKNYLQIRSTEFGGTVTQKQQKDTFESAPKPLITSTLQQQASVTYSIGPKQAMRAAQTLYEAGLITYMRTDQAVLSQEAVQQAQNWVKTHLGNDYIGTSKKTSEQQKQQNAHEAIRPTNFNVRELLDGNFGYHEKNIYKLIWQRAVQSTMSAARGEKILITFVADSDDDLQWIAEWTREIFPGWKAIGKVSKLDDNDDISSKQNINLDIWLQAQKIPVGMKLTWTEIQAQPYESRPSPRYNEATLVRELERKGIGRPSTFASLIQTIQDREYVKIADIDGKPVTIKTYSINQKTRWPPSISTSIKIFGKEKQKLVPTAQGQKVLEFMIKHFQDLFAYTYTAEMENRLDQISDGKELWKTILNDNWQSYKSRYESLKIAGKEAKKQRTAESKLPLNDFTWNGQQVFKKQGPYGNYIETQDISGKILRVSIGSGDSNEEILIKIQAKLTQNEVVAQNTLGRWATYEVRQGQYGPYIMKKSNNKGAKPKFVSWPSEMSLENIQEKPETEIAALFSSIESSIPKKSGRGGGAGGGGRRGGGGGRRGGGA